jgi:chromosome segregation ATPase
MPWKPAPVTDLQRQVDALQFKLVRLNRELSDKQQYASRLEYLMRERSKRIDELTGTIDRLREQNRRLDAEADRLCELVRLSP